MRSRVLAESSRRAALHAINLDLMQLDLKLSRVETLLRGLLQPPAAPRLGASDNRKRRRVEPHRPT